MIRSMGEVKTPVHSTSLTLQSLEFSCKLNLIKQHTGVHTGLGLSEVGQHSKAIWAEGYADTPIVCAAAIVITETGRWKLLERFHSGSG